MRHLIQNAKILNLQINYSVDNCEETKFKNETFDLKRLDISAESFQVTYLVSIKKTETLEEIIRIIRSEYPDIIINFIDQNQVPSI